MLTRTTAAAHLLALAVTGCEADPGSLGPTEVDPARIDAPALLDVSRCYLLPLIEPDPLSAYICSVDHGVASCCIAGVTSPGSVGVFAFAAAGIGALSLDENPLGLTLEGAPASWVSTGAERRGLVTWDLCSMSADDRRIGVHLIEREQGGPISWSTYRVIELYTPDC